jgi:two-component system sensor histidine kinase/response regulator
LSVQIVNALRKQGKNITITNTAVTAIKESNNNKLAAKYPLKILLAEDDVFNQMVALQVLENIGYSATIAENGRIAVEHTQDGTYDLVLMDVQMPEMDGFEATKCIRETLAQQPVILAMTANAMDGDRNRCILAGMDDYISKPVNIEELVVKLEKWALHIHRQ